MLKAGLSLLLAVFSLNLLARSEAELYCQKHGGELAQYAELNNRHRPTGVKKVFCEFVNKKEGLKLIAPETLASTTSTFAVNMFRHGVAKGPFVKGASPAYGYCVRKLKGTYVNWRKIATGGESGMCSFSDGSEMSAWALVYGAERLPILNSLLAYQE